MAGTNGASATTGFEAKMERQAFEFWDQMRRASERDERIKHAPGGLGYAQ